MNAKARDYRLYLHDILSAIARIQEYTHSGKTSFFANVLIQDGVIRQLSIIGEASTKLPEGIKAEHTAIPWKKITGMRYILTHDHSDTDLSMIWDTVEHDLPVLLKTVILMLKKTAA